MKKLNRFEQWFANFKFYHLIARDDRWYPFPYLELEDLTDNKKEVFQNTLIANYPSSHDGLLFGTRRHVTKTVIEQGLWRKRENIGIHIIEDREAGPKSGYHNRDCEYKLYYLK